jgi:hypothetical protein
MWISIADEPIPEYFKNGRPYLLGLYFHERYGYKIEKQTDIAIAVWDSSCGCFRDSTTRMKIDSIDISEWWKDI